MQPGTIGRYEVHTLLGKGGMGTVYKGLDPLIGRWVAIKTLTIQDDFQRVRFKQEVQVAGKLDHPHIVTIYDVGTEGELAYIVMELVEGGTLANRRPTPGSWAGVVSLLLPICRALAYAHGQGVIHRDVKPANILLSNEGQVKLADFGVARMEVAHRLTTSGNIVGTPLYTAPEQIRDEPLDGRADLFSLGIVLFELIAGRHPFEGRTLAQVIYLLTQPEPLDLKPLTPLAPAALVEVLSQALEKDPAGRFPDAEAMASALSSCLEQSAASSSPANVSVAPAPQLDYVVADLTLTPAEETLLQSAFAGHDRLYLEREFRRGFSEARVLLATPVRSGRRMTKVVLKLDTPPAIDREWRAYRDFVADILPPTTARITRPPVYAAEGNQALLWYSFAGEVGQATPESLGSYYAHHSGQTVANLLETGVFETFGQKWWQQRTTTDLILRREYDRLLPVHLVLQPHPLSEGTHQVLVAGEVNSFRCRALQQGQVVHMQGFVVAEIEADPTTLTLQALPRSGSATNPIRIRVLGLERGQLSQQVGEVVSTLAGIVVATRDDLLAQLAQPAFPDQDLKRKRLTIGKQAYPNPLFDYEALLDHLLFTMTSTIHGDLNLENILVTPERKLAWLIDFAATREGHALADFIRLETQVIIKLLPETGVRPEQVIRLMQALHRDESFPRRLPRKLKKPFAVLAVIRRMAKACLYNSQNWDEYYLGLVITLIGALKFKELEVEARRLALAAAAMVRGLIEAPELQVTEEFSRPGSRWRPGYIAGLAAALLLVAILAGLGFWLWRPSSSSETTASPTLIAAAPEVSSPTVAPSATPIAPPTATLAAVSATSPTPMPPERGEGRVNGPLDIRSGPGLEYPAVGNVPDGNPVQVTGRSADGRWWLIAHPSGPGGFGWVLAEFVDLQVTLALPLALASPPPTVTRTPTAMPTSSPTPTVSSTTTSKQDSPSGLEEDFTNREAFLERWERFPNGGTVSIEEGFLSLSSEGSNAFPYLRLRQNPFPTTGDFTLEVELQYTQVGEFGTGLVIGLKLPENSSPVGTEPDPAVELLKIWQDKSYYKALVVGTSDLIMVALAMPDTDRHTVRFVYEEGLVQFYLDGTLVGVKPEAGLRPTTLWFGNPYRTPEAGNWSDLRVFSIKLLRETSASPGQTAVVPTPTAGPLPVCQIDPAWEFPDLWQAYGASLACPLGTVEIVPILAEEAFEGGHMFWRSDTDEVYVIYDGRHDGTNLLAGEWQNYRSPWDGTNPDGVALSPPPGRVEPKRGFGWLWRTHLGGPNGPLGWALDKEYGFDNTGRAQQFENGIAFKGSDSKVYALLNDGRFFAYSPSSGQ